jgi:hypothetical protein
LVGVIRGRLGAIEYEGRYHVIHGEPIQGLHVGVVIVGVGHLEGSPPSLANPTPALAFFGLEGHHSNCLHSLIE